MVFEICELAGKRCRIDLKSKMFGRQSFKRDVVLIDDDERIGVVINGQDIFIRKSDIISHGRYYISDEDFTISLREIC